MYQENIDIEPYLPEYRSQILGLWERSVLATHDFLSPEDFREIKELVGNIPFDDFDLYCLLQINTVLGFVGVADRKIEMLFLDPDYFGRGLGRTLLDYAVQELQANRLDVNAQNEMALRFYLKYGFVEYERTEKDDQGRNYPLIRMKLPIIASD